MCGLPRRNISTRILNPYLEDIQTPGCRLHLDHHLTLATLLYQAEREGSIQEYAPRPNTPALGLSLMKEKSRGISSTQCHHQKTWSTGITLKVSLKSQYRLLMNPKFPILLRTEDSLKQLSRSCQVSVPRKLLVKILRIKVAKL